MVTLVTEFCSELTWNGLLSHVKTRLMACGSKYCSVEVNK